MCPVSHDSFMCVTLLIHMCDMTHQTISARHVCAPPPLLATMSLHSCVAVCVAVCAAVYVGLCCSVG